MKNFRYNLYHVIIALLIYPCLTLTGCTTVSKTEKVKNTESKITVCTEPRPQICTLQYQPVCALRQDATEKTYATGCTACSDKQVESYREGACE
jgi:hypothetical protein